MRRKGGEVGEELRSGPAKIRLKRKVIGERKDWKGPIQRTSRNGPLSNSISGHRQTSGMVSVSCQSQKHY